MKAKLIQLEPVVNEYGKAFAVFEISAASLAELEEYRDKDAELSIKKPSKEKTRNANSYFHVLARKIGQCDGISETHSKNILIGLYGQPEYIEDVKATIKTNLTPEIVNEIEEPHFKFIKCDDDGIYWYYIYRGTHTYNREEMSKLIDGTVQIAMSKGIETLTPDETKHLLEVWKGEKS